jgi:hypothetical protein
MIGLKVKHQEQRKKERERKEQRLIRVRKMTQSLTLHRSKHFSFKKRRMMTQMMISLQHPSFQIPRIDRGVEKEKKKKKIK